MGQTRVPIGHIMGPPQIFVLAMGTNGAKPHLCGHHRRVAVAIGHIMSPPQVIVSMFVPSAMALCLHGFPTSQQRAWMEPNHVPVATTEGPCGVICHIMGPPQGFTLMVSANGAKPCPRGHQRRVVAATGHVGAPPEIFVLTMGADRANPQARGHHQTAVITTGHITDLPEVFVWTMGTNRAKPRPRGHHGRAVAATDHVMDPP